MELCDVTLREGAQMPERNYTIDQRVAAGKSIDRLGVEMIQAGFPVVGEDHADVVRRLTPNVDAQVSALARARIGDVDTAMDAEPDVISIFASISDVMLEHVFDKEREEVVGWIGDAVDHAEDHGYPIRIGLMDGFRTNTEHIISAAERFPDYPIRLSDTIGNRTPAFVTEFLDGITAGGIDLSRLGVHFHDDLGVATANTLAAARMGVGCADVSVASLGERAGNAPIEQLVVAGDHEHGRMFDIETAHLIDACTDALDALGEDIDPRRPVLGEEVVRHEAGLHTAIMLDHPHVFEPFDPTEYGGSRELVFGSLSGRSAAQKLLERADREVTEERARLLLKRLDEEGSMNLEEATDLAYEIP